VITIVGSSCGRTRQFASSPPWCLIMHIGRCLTKPPGGLFSFLLTSLDTLFLFRVFFLVMPGVKVAFLLPCGTLIYSQPADPPPVLRFFFTSLFCFVPPPIGHTRERAFRGSPLSFFRCDRGGVEQFLPFLPFFTAVPRDPGFVIPVPVRTPTSFLMVRPEPEKFPNPPLFTYPWQ